MRYLLDTCVVSDYFRRRGKVAAALHARAPHDLGISAITEHELWFGLHRQKAEAASLRSKVVAFLSVVKVVPFDSAAARESASIRASTERAGKPIGWFDGLIAGAAVAQRLVLVSSNVREFSRVEGLVLEDWR